MHLKADKFQHLFTSQKKKKILLKKTRNREEFSQLDRQYLPKKHVYFSSVQFSCSVVSNSLWPHGLQHARTPCPSPIPIVYPKYVHWVGDAIQPSHPLSYPSPPALNLSQHQGLFKWVNSLHQMAKVSEFQLQHQPFQWTPRTDLL